MSKRFEKLGAEVARVQDETLADGTRRAAVRRRLLLGESRSSPPRSSRWEPTLAWAGAMAAVVLAVVVLWPSVPEPIAYRVEGEAESRLLDREIAAPNDGARSIAFTDGSAVRLSPSARARVRQLRIEGATLVLDRGEATVSVQHRDTTKWSVEAGPFLVRVTGTRFRVGWQPEAESFELEVFEGEVRVRGPSLPERTVRRGQEVRQNPAATVEPKPEPPQVEEPIRERTALPEPHPRKQTGTVTPAGAPSYEPPAVPTPSEAEAPESTRPEQDPEASAKPSSAEPPSWKTLLDRRDYSALLTELGPEQLEQAIWQADAAQLLDLGAAARELGDARAGSIYTAVRSRFSGTDAAADAAFLLGRMQFHSGAHRSSATWFETYLRERPDGRLAREAAGRLVEAYQHAGDTDRAHEAAEQYLRRYPNGPHAGLARSVLQ
jgi:TolA-binding protein